MIRVTLEMEGGELSARRVGTLRLQLENGSHYAFQVWEEDKGAFVCTHEGTVPIPSRPEWWGLVSDALNVAFGTKAP